MRRLVCMGLVIVISLIFCACKRTDRPDPDAPITTVQQLADETTTSVPAHSELYLPEYTSQQIFEYFKEVALVMEYADGTGDISVVQKWKEPILYSVYGDYTDEDLAILTDLFTRLNKIDGFPGIYAADTEKESGSLCIHFFDQEHFNSFFSDIINGEDAYGAAHFWYYNETNEIYTADVGYRTDAEQSIRESVLLEEIINVLGISDTIIREDSIVYQYSDDNVSLSDVDWVILKLLYNPAIQPGMDAESCQTVIQELYY